MKPSIRMTRVLLLRCTITISESNGVLVGEGNNITTAHRALQGVESPSSSNVRPKPSSFPPLTCS